jgi:Fe-S oxidoreductase
MKFLSRIVERFANTLYYPGCLTKFVLKDIEDKYKEILQRMRIDPIFLLRFCCGSPARSGGYEKDFAQLASKNLSVFKEHGIKKIITNCPACYRTFKDYPKVLEEKWNIQVEHITTVLWRALERGRLRPKGKSMVVTYHDPCHLGRHSGIYDEPRNILKALGFSLIEFPYNKEEAFCCGGGGGLLANNPALANQIAQRRAEQAPQVEAIVTTCPLCYHHLRKNSDITVIEMAEVVLGAL